MSRFGRFSAKIQNSKTGEVKTLPRQNNLILDNFFSRIESAKSLSYIYAHLGTGTAPPARTDTALTSPSANYLTSGQYGNGKTVTDRSVTGNTFTFAVDIEMTATQGAFQGNFTEIGLSYNANPSALFARALIKDEQGNPTTLTLGEFDILTLYYELGFTIDLTDPTFSTKTIDVGGVATEVKASWFDYGRHAGVTPDVGGMWGGATSNGSEPLYPLGKAQYFRPFTGTITDYENPMNNSYTFLGAYDFSSARHKADGTSVGTYTDRLGDYLAGEATGTWNGLMISTTSGMPDPAKGLSISDTAVCVLEFNPPIEKGPNDVINITEIEFLASAEGV